MGTIVRYPKKQEMREESMSSELSDEICRNWIKAEFFRVSISTGSFLGIAQKRRVS